MSNNPQIESKYIVDAFLSKRFPNKIQIFNTKNVVGDKMETIYNDGTVKIDFCSHWGYIEIFGLSGRDYEYIYFLHDGDSHPEDGYFTLQDIFEVIAADALNKLGIDLKSEEGE